MVHFSGYTRKKIRSNLNYQNMLLIRDFPAILQMESCYDYFTDFRM